MASKNSIYRAEQMIKDALVARGTKNNIQVGKDDCGYHIYRTNETGIETTMYYGLRAKEAEFMLNGMLTALTLTEDF